MHYDPMLITFGVYSPSHTTSHLLQEQFQEKQPFQIIVFMEEAAFLASLKKKVFQAYLWDKSALFLSWHTFSLGKEKKEEIPKPFRLSLLLEKLLLIKKEGVFKVGSYVFKEKQRLLINEKGEPVPLREKEAAFLLFLLKAPHQKADRQTLLQHVWGYAPHTQTHTLETHVYHLRQKIEEDPANPKILVNEGVGYRLNDGV